MTQILSGCAALVMMLLVIINSKTALQGAQEGIQMCLNVVIASLFPFIFLSIWGTSAFSGISLRLLTPIARMAGIPNGCESILLMALLGGYPVGAQTVYAAWENRALDTHTAKRLLAFCNNAGPSFIFGLLGNMFANPLAVWSVWLIHAGSALLVGALLPGKTTTGSSVSAGQPVSISAALQRAIRSMACICGWVILFRTLLSFLHEYILCHLSVNMQVIIGGVLELTNGCLALGSVSNEPVRFVIASCLLGTGGMCVFLQTMTVTGELKTGLYFPGKLLQTGISLLASLLLLPVLYPAR